MIAAAIWSIGVGFLIVSFYFKEKHYDLAIKQALLLNRREKPFKLFNIIFKFEHVGDKAKATEDVREGFMYIELQRECLDTKENFGAVLDHYYFQFRSEAIANYFKDEL